jgi:hypothetical protein
VFFSTKVPSSFNKKPGSYVQIGNRVDLGQYPGSEFTMAPKPR